MHDKGLEGEYGRYRRGRKEYKAYTFFSWIQPKVAWIGLIGCILVFAFTSVTWWNTSATFSKVAVAYAAVCLLPHLLYPFPLSRTCKSSTLRLTRYPACHPPRALHSLQNYQRPPVGASLTGHQRSGPGTQALGLVEK
jgi:hypothetical protein